MCLHVFCGADGCNKPFQPPPQMLNKALLNSNMLKVLMLQASVCSSLACSFFSVAQGLSGHSVCTAEPFCSQGVPWFLCVLACLSLLASCYIFKTLDHQAAFPHIVCFGWPTIQLQTPCCVFRHCLNTVDTVYVYMMYHMYWCCKVGVNGRKQSMNMEIVCCMYLMGCWRKIWEFNGLPNMLACMHKPCPPLNMCIPDAMHNQLYVALGLGSQLSLASPSCVT
jgi:hypothetical protein